MFRGLRKILGICTLKDYLSKDKNGVTYLENLLKEGKELDYNQELKLRNSIEVGYIYAKYDKDLFGFKYNEKQLFTKIDNEYFIEYLLSKNCCYNYMIDVITEHIEIIDILIKHDRYKLIWLNKKLVNKLLTKDNNNDYLINKYINDEKLMKNLIDKCDDGKILLEIFEKDNIKLLKYCNEQALMTKINNETLLEYLLNKKIIPNNLISIPNNKEYIEILINKDILEYFKYANEEILLNKINNKTVLELLLEKNKLDKINLCITSEKTIRILYKLNRLDLAKQISIKLLAKSTKEIIGKDKNEQTFLEYLLDKGYKPTFSDVINNKDKNKKIIYNILYKNNELELLAKSIDKKNLFYKFNNNELLINKLIENNINIFLIDNIDIKMLLNNYKDNKTYLDYVLEMIKDKKIKYNLTNLSFTDCNIDDRVKFYITLAKHDMIKYIKNLTVDDLLKRYDGKILLEELLKKDKEITMNKILSDNVKSNVKIVGILKNKGIVITDINTPIKDLGITSEYLNKQQNRYGIGPLYHDGDYLLSKLQLLFITDGKSDYNLIMSLVNGYRQALITNYDIFIKELELLIQTKEKYPDMYYIKTNKGSCFKKTTGSVYCNDINIRTIIHETGHALHWYMCKSKYPSNLEQILSDVRNNKDIIKKIESFSIDYYQKKKEFQISAEIKYKDYIKNYYTKEKNIEIDEYLKKVKNILKEEYKNLGIDGNKIDKILNEIINKEEYIKNQKTLFIEEQIHEMIRKEYEILGSIFDILDGIFEGDFYSGNLYNEKGELIKGILGHGIPYYSCELENIFTEMIAQFSVISKSYNASEMLDLLKDTIGEELYNLISEYYYNNIIGIENNKKIRTLL